jgi:hypothetical protein
MLTRSSTDSARNLGPEGFMLVPLQKAVRLIQLRGARRGTCRDLE